MSNMKSIVMNDGRLRVGDNPKPVPYNVPDEAAAVAEPLAVGLDAVNRSGIHSPISPSMSLLPR